MSGTSAKENLGDFQNWVKTLIKAQTWGRKPLVLDVGAGQGTYADAIGGEHVRLEAVEMWPPSVATLRADSRYTEVFEEDIRDWDQIDWRKRYDIVIFGDVLEHMNIHDAHVVWDRAYQSGAYVVASVPNSPYPQGAIDGNHLEEHLILDPVKELIQFLPIPIDTWEYPITNTYIWKKD